MHNLKFKSYLDSNSILEFYFADSSRVPRFKFRQMQNHTVRVGSEATFACIVEHLGGYKVWKHKHFILRSLALVFFFQQNIYFVQIMTIAQNIIIIILLYYRTRGHEQVLRQLSSSPISNQYCLFYWCWPLNKLDN